MAPGKQGPVVAAQAVHKTYRAAGLDVAALRGVSLDVERGEFVAVMGPSGCGKTTLLNCLSGLDDVDEGAILLDGVDLANLGDSERTRLRSRRMGFIFQSFNLVPVLSAEQNVALPLLFAGSGRSAATAKAREILKALGLADRLRHRPRELSGGQQQRVAIARALVNDPAIIWADEPTGNLDSATGKQILELLLQLNGERGATLVVLTHSDAVAAAAHRVVRMDSGRIVSSTRGKAA